MQNIDPAEIAKFDQLSSSWWDTDGESRALHDINQCRGDFVAETSLAGKKVLDVGCGGGLLSEYLAKAGASVVGIDASATIIEVAREHAQTSHLNIDYETTDVESFAERNLGRFDIVTCMEMLEHVPKPDEIVAAVARCLRPHGVAYFSTINRTPKAYAFSIIAAEYLLKLLPIGTHEFKNFIRPSELSRWCRDAGLVTTEMHGIHYMPFTRKASLVKDLSVNFITKTRLDRKHDAAD